MKKLFFFFLSLASLQAFAMNAPYAEIPEHLRKCMTAWVSRPSSKAMLEIMRSKSLNRQQKLAQAQELGFRNMGNNSNYVFHIPECGMVVKIPHENILLVNYIVMLGYLRELNERKLTPTQIAQLKNDFLHSDIPTQQGMSQVKKTNILLQAGASGVYDTKVVQFEPAYAYPYPSALVTQEPSDASHFVIQTFQPNLKSIEPQEMSLQQLQELTKAGWSARLFDYNDELRVREDGKITVTDLEKPDRLLDIPADAADIYAINSLERLVQDLKEEKRQAYLKFLKDYFTEDKFVPGPHNSYTYFQNLILKYME